MSSFMDNQQQKIEKAFKEKMKRWDKTSLSILVSWAINNAVNSLPEETKKKWSAVKNKVEERYPYFIDLYRSWMLDNMPTEEVKVTRGDFIQAVKKAPEKQAEQDLADEVGEERKEEEIQSPKDNPGFYKE